MAKRDDEPLREAMLALLKWLRARRLPVMVIGGMAVSLLGRPRMTADLDAVTSLPNDQWDMLIKSGKKYGVEPRVKNCVDFARESMVFLLRHVPTKVPIDLSVGTTEFEQQALANHQTRRELGVQVPLPRVEDLIVYKAVARRPIDVGDVVVLLKQHPSVDLEHVRSWLEQFAELLDDPTLVTDFMKLVSRKR